MSLSPEIQHELERFKTMTVQQLQTRLLRMTIHSKLESFEWVASQIARKTGRNEYNDLANSAREKRLGF